MGLFKNYLEQQRIDVADAVRSDCCLRFKDVSPMSSDSELSDIICHDDWKQRTKPFVI